LDLWAGQQASCSDMTNRQVGKPVIWRSERFSDTCFQSASPESNCKPPAPHLALHGSSIQLGSFRPYLRISFLRIPFCPHFMRQ
jgi:hypothetical protein